MRVKSGDRYPNDYTVAELKDIAGSIKVAVPCPSTCRWRPNTGSTTSVR